MATLSLPYTLIPDTLAKASEVQGNLDAIKSFVQAEAVQKDASVAFTAVPSGPATDPSSANQLARKSYVDGVFGYALAPSASRPHATPTNVANFADTGFSHGITVTSTGFTVVTTGLYEVQVYTYWQDTTNGVRRTRVLVNDAVPANGGIAAEFEPGILLEDVSNAARPVSLTAGNTVKVQLTHNEGVAIAAGVHLWLKLLR